MTTGNLTWEDAAFRVLSEAEEPLRTTDVGERIAQQHLTRSVGSTPTQQASVALRSLLKQGKIEQVGRLYAIPQIADQARQEAEAEYEADYVAPTDSSRLSVKAYGLYWRRNLVDWTPTNGKLLGNSGSDPIDFADQDGIYLLHSGNEVAYVGQSRTPNSRTGLYNRLRSHHNDSRKTDRWETFSWFGFRPVDNESGQLLEAPETATIQDVINLIEAIFIEGLMPRLNMRSGEGAKDWLEDNQYFQTEDPQLIANRFSALATVGASLR